MLRCQRYVKGSIPLPRTKIYAPLAQSGMRRFSQKENRVGSNPTRGTS